jgi:hypothetical protein
MGKGKTRNMYRDLEGKYEGKRQLARPRRRLKYYIKRTA